MKNYIQPIVDKYIDILVMRESFLEERDESILQLQFPFKSYRKGQRELAVSCFNSIKEQGTLFVQAPTGIGKTISTIFPAV